jgi:hypothetical protein
MYALSSEKVADRSVLKTSPKRETEKEPEIFPAPASGIPSEPVSGETTGD